VRVVFFGTPDEAVPPLRALAQGGHEVAAVVTQPDRRRGRGSALVPSPVKREATELGLLVLQPVRVRDIVGALTDLHAEVAVVVAFGQLLPPAVLSTVPGGFVNLHFSLLPRWRGAAPVERAILAGDTETGVCLMAIDEGMDTGPIYACARTPIGPDETAGDLRDRLVEIGTRLLIEVLPTLPERPPTPQIGEPTLAPKLTVEEFHLDWSRPTAELYARIRAGEPRPGAWTTVEGRRLKIRRARLHPGSAGGIPGTVSPSGVVTTGDGALELVLVQPEGRAPMPVGAWLAGRRGAPARLGS
jgi:methionyl-tRNA formyltransferase